MSPPSTTRHDKARLVWILKEIRRVTGGYGGMRVWPRANRLEWVGTWLERVVRTMCYGFPGIFPFHSPALSFHGIRQSGEGFDSKYYRQIDRDARSGSPRYARDGWVECDWNPG